MNFFTAVLSFLLLLLASESHAIMAPMTTEQLTHSSQLVVRGTVTRVESYWCDDGKAIFSKAYIFVTDVIHGEDPSQEIVVEYEGGEIGDIGYRVSDSVLFEEGEDTLLFLQDAVAARNASPGPASESTGATALTRSRHLVGKAQGKYSIDRAGIARKRGFSVLGEPGSIDNNIEVDKLIDKIQRARP